MKFFSRLFAFLAIFFSITLAPIHSSQAADDGQVSAQIPQDIANLTDVASQSTIAPSEVCPNLPDEYEGDPVIDKEELRCLLTGYIPLEERKYLDKTLDYLAPALNNAIKKYEIEQEGGELAIFLSQLIHESGSFKFSTEIGSLSYYTPAEKEDRGALYLGKWDNQNFCSAHKAGSQGGARYFDDFRRRFSCFNPDRYPGPEVRESNPNFRNVSVQVDSQRRWLLETSMRRNSYPSRWRGRGLIQLTHCINYLSYAEHQAHFNHCREKKISGDCLAYAASKSTERFEVDGKEISFASGNLQCSEEELKKIIEKFNRENQGLNLDQGELLTDSYNMANICRPKHMVESAAWFWKKGSRSCSKIATGERYYGDDSQANSCRCDLSNKAGEWNAKYARNSAGEVIYDAQGEPARGECQFEKKVGKCGSVERIESDMTRDEIARVAGASRCINGAYCNHLDQRAEIYRHVRDYLQRTPAERARYCMRRN